MPQASRADLACAPGDLDEDGRKDLVIPLPTSAEPRPRLMLLRGLPAAPFFDVENAVTILLNSAPSFPAHRRLRWWSASSPTGSGSALAGWISMATVKGRAVKTAPCPCSFNPARLRATRTRRLARKNG